MEHYTQRHMPTFYHVMLLFTRDPYEHNNTIQSGWMVGTADQVIVENKRQLICHNYFGKKEK
jgi:hypothetical protein